ncbi:MAG: 50S ribosomal protein L21 [Candidatus Anoxymicrobium japonicum]|uniref:Large ribosomal subunit protein bL21 n=1 Tax=Candidatus Anoxymicrobium japonicum TaxID=2013648 RepID=A0A2N3G8E5_9ACTN|nr:MAG: 50S ribosomal protein L21 [Candidatus Anoxymicrobium japonicum]
MYAVIRTGSKQYRVAPGNKITVEKLDIAEGKEHSFEDVVLLHDGKNVIVSPSKLSKARVAARVVSHGKSKKTVVFKYKSKKTYRRKKGHRQQLTRLEIVDIIDGKSAAKKPAAKSA